MESNNNSENLIYDVIIIGSGMGGLAAGNILTNKGYKVLILEKHFMPGGYCTNFKRKDFIFDASTHLINGCEKGGMIYKILEKFNAENSIEFIKLEELFRWVDAENNIDFRVSSNYDKYISDLVATFPEFEAEIRKYYKRFSNVFKFMTGFVSKGLFGKVYLFFRYFRSFLRFIRLFNKTTSEVVDKYITNKQVKDIILALSGFFGLPTEELSAIIFFAATLAYYVEGAYYPRGGSGAFSKALADIFKNNGGKLELSTEVTQIFFDGKLVTGVLVKDKSGNEKHFNARSIISNADATLLATELCPSGTLPPKYTNKVKSKRPSVSAVVLFLGLNIDLKDYGFSDYEYWTPWGGDFSLEHQNYILETADYSKLPAGAISIYSNVDPDCCPKGKSVVTAIYYAIPKPFEEALDENGNRGEDYKALKGKIADQFLSQMKVILNIPDLESHIEVIELATPLTFKRYTNNRDGAFIGWEMKNDQMILKNLSQKTPIKNLFQCGQWTLPGGGVSAVIMSGDSASKKIDKYLRKKYKK